MRGLIPSAGGISWNMGENKRSFLLKVTFVYGSSKNPRKFIPKIKKPFLRIGVPTFK